MATCKPETGPELWRIALWDCLEGISTQSFRSILQNNPIVQFVFSTSHTRNHYFKLAKHRFISSRHCFCCSSTSIHKGRLDRFRFLGNCPPTTPLRYLVGQFPRNLNLSSRLALCITPGDMILFKPDNGWICDLTITFYMRPPHMSPR